MRTRSRLAAVAGFLSLSIAATVATGAPGSRAPDGPTAVLADTGEVRYVLAAEGSEARYRVREQLARIDFPSDAVGATTVVQGAIALGSDGAILTDHSRFVVDLASIESDSQRRDNYVRRRVFQSDSFPDAVFVPTGIEGVALPLPAGEVTFRITGDMTIHGISRPTTWDVTASRSGDAVVGKATTRFRFADFQLAVPRVASVLSVEDDIRLEFDFRLVPEQPVRQ